MNVLNVKEIGLENQNLNILDLYVQIITKGIQRFITSIRMAHVINAQKTKEEINKYTNKRIKSRF